MQRRATILVVLCLSASASSAEPEKLSGLAFVSPETRALQADDFANPGMLWVLEGESLWNSKPPGAEKSCADCHASAEKSMRGVAVRYPAFDADSSRPIDLQGQINQCRKERQGAAEFAWESRELVALSTFVAHQSRGMPIAPPDDPRLTPFREKGEALYQTRIGQIDLACADCHDARAGRRLSGNLIPQAHPTGYPLYRLEWQSVGTLQRRMRGCMSGVRAESYPYGAAEFIDLELYLMSRAASLPMETPAVRP